MGGVEGILGRGFEERRVLRCVLKKLVLERPLP